MPKNTTQCPRPGLEPGPLDPETSALTMRPPRLPCAVKFSNISEIWSSMMLFNSEITTILVLVHGNSCLVSANSVTGLNLCLCQIKSLLGNWPSHLSHEANCLRLFLARVWQLTISRYSRRIFRRDNAFDNAFSIIFCLHAKDQCCSLELSLGR